MFRLTHRATANQGRAQEFKRGGGPQFTAILQLTFSEKRALVLASTSAGLILLKSPNDCGSLQSNALNLTPKYCYG